MLHNLYYTRNPYKHTMKISSGKKKERNCCIMIDFEEKIEIIGIYLTITYLCYVIPEISSLFITFLYRYKFWYTRDKRLLWLLFLLWLLLTIRCIWSKNKTLIIRLIDKSPIYHFDLNSCCSKFRIYIHQKEKNPRGSC